jgi:beta-glucosidase/6-phospho-beta-glucosidase/beta-galactosidase
MPFGNGPINEVALAHYDDVIDTCIEYGVEPSVTLYHWDLPLNLQNTYGGWLSPQVVDDFKAYANVVFNRYGNKVSRWFTVNEPIVFWYTPLSLLWRSTTDVAFSETYPLPDYYFTNTSIPKQQQPFWCGHHVLLAHAEAYHLGKSIMGSNASISFKTNGGYKIPLTNSSDDALAVQRAWDFNEGWFAHPTFIDGDYPQYLKDYVSTFLPEFTSDQKAMINGSCDVFAHDAYTSQFYMGNFANWKQRKLLLTPLKQHLTPACPPALATYRTRCIQLAPTRRIRMPRLQEAGMLVLQQTQCHLGSTKQQIGSLLSYTTCRIHGSRVAALQ